MIRKTEIQKYHMDWWPFTPTTKHIEATRIETVKHGFAIISASSTPTENNEPIFTIKPTKFVDFTKTKEYKRLWRRTHRGTHWLPPKRSLPL